MALGMCYLDSRAALRTSVLRGTACDEREEGEVMALKFHPTQPPARGSLRSFVRLECEGSTYIFMIEPDEEQLDRYLYVQHLFERHGVKVPKVLDVRYGQPNLVLLEDCGFESLYDRWSSSAPVSRFYFQALEQAIKIWDIAEAELPNFAPEVVKWEVDYFLENFLLRFLGVEANALGYLRDISEAFHRVIEEHPAVIHRDLQSQNILIREDEVFIIDFQSAHVATPYYDLASLLEDPYVELSHSLKVELMGVVEHHLSSKGVRFSSRAYRVSAIHRLMQASGAYVKLALSDGKLHFLRYLRRSIPRLVKLLRLMYPIGMWQRMEKLLLRRLTA